MTKYDYTLDDIAAALQYLNCQDTHEWLCAGMAIKDEYGDNGFDVWDDFSQGDGRYDSKQVRTKWKSFKGGSARGKVTIGTILHWAFQRGFELARPELSPAEKARFAAEQQKRRKELAIKSAQEEADLQRWYDAVASVSQKILPLLKPVGSSPYLGKKKIHGSGCLFPREPFLLDFKPNFQIEIVTGFKQIKAVLDRVNKNKDAGREEDDAIVSIKRGAILIPLYNSSNQLRNFQVIFGDGKNKRFLTNGQKSGLFFVIGSLSENLDLPVVFVEGFATGASVHMATKWPVVVTFDAYNMPAVAHEFKGMLRHKIFAGDNDWEKALELTPSGKNKINTGIVKSKESASIAHGVACHPVFNGDGISLTDFNDLHVTEGLPVVKLQLESVLQGFQTVFEIPPVHDNAPPDYSDIPLPDSEYSYSENAENHSPNERQQAKGEKTAFTLEILLKRFSFVAQDGSAWDTETESTIKKTAFNDLVGKELAAEWRSHNDRVDINQADVQSIKLKRLREKRMVDFEGPNRWKLNFIYNDNGEIKADIGNAKLVLEHDSRWRGVLGYCDFSYRVLKRSPPPFDNGVVGEWTDSDTDRFRIWLSENYRFTPKAADALGAIVVMAESNRFHPVREYLTGLKWDRICRLDQWLYSYMGATFDTYSALVGRMFLIGAVARVMRPPVKMDTVIIFEGLQGIGKSTALKILAGDWFSDTPFVLGDKDGFQQMQGVWIVELAELDSFNKADHTRAKQFFGSQVDRYRPSYGRLTQTFPRQCVFAGSTNQDAYLRDATGNRRYWPVACTKMDAAALSADRDQLWAEAYQRYLQGDTWWPEDKHKEIFSEQQENRFDADVWEELIDEWLSRITKNRVLMSEIMEDALGLEAAQMKPPEQKRIGQIMSHLKWEKVRARVAGGRETGYERPKVEKVA
jgi:predicted P-loop ATPase